jgi:rod shape-determining protein MreC
MGKMNEDNLRAVKIFFTDISSSVLSIIGVPVSSVTQAAGKINSIIFMYSENKNLKQENVELYKWKDLGHKLLAENQELRRLLNTSNTVSHSFITAKVISNSAGSYNKTITLNVGKKHGVSIGSAVTNNFGMIGRVVEVGSKVSRVLLITDINSQIPVYFEKTRHNAILRGQNSDFLEVKYLKPRVYLLDKDRLITSGDGGLLPRGLVVGEYIKNLNNELNKISILPTRNWDKLSNLKVILYKNEEIINGSE